MENEQLQQQEPQETPAEFKPRPRWQRILAIIGLTIFIAFLIMYYVNILRSGA